MKPLIVVVGPTAVGKSELSIELALKLNGEIISADSVQLYKYFNIGTAKLTKEEQKGVPHHLLDVLEPDEEFSVAQFQMLARNKINEIIERGKLPFLVGGTGLYIQAVIDPYEFPEIRGFQELREKYKKLKEKGNNDKLLEELKRVDPVTAERLHPNDSKRIIRALEVYYLTGRPISLYQKKQFKSLYDLVMIGLTRNRSELYRRIEERVDKMYSTGLVNEVKSLLKKGYRSDLKPFQSLGYKQVVSFLKGDIDLEAAISQTKKATKNYAKRQLTWFRRDPRIHWFVLNEKISYNDVCEQIIQLICRIIPVCVE